VSNLICNGYAPWGVIALLIRLLATVPTVGDAIEALTDFCDELMEMLKQMAVLAAELDARDHVQVDDIRQVGSKLTPQSSC
jgi:nuclear pore complex protein Nup205